MPLAMLFIEGNLESETLNPIFQGSPVLKHGGSKNSLKPRAIVKRQEDKVAAGYLRDRDFDFEPPEDVSTPTIDYSEGSTPIGWRWCRHEMENYLIDPAIITASTGWPAADVEAAILGAAKTISNYQAARWTVGIVRRSLPPAFELRTRPDGLNEIELPNSLDSRSANDWAMDNVMKYRDQFIGASDSSATQESFSKLLARFDDAFLSDIKNVLLWFSGKDLLAAMAEWLSKRAVTSPGLFRANLRDWIIANPDRSLDLLPEWRSLISRVRG